MRNIAAIVLAAGVGAGAAGPASAGFYSGSMLLDECGANLTDPVFFQKDAQCRAYVTGVADSFSCEDPFAGSRWRSPQDVTQAQIKDVAVKFLRSNPERLPLLASVLVAHALQEAFPCP